MDFFLNTTIFHQRWSPGLDLYQRKGLERQQQSVEAEPQFGTEKFWDMETWHGWTIENDLQTKYFVFGGEEGGHLCFIVLGNTQLDIVKEASYGGLRIFTATRLSMCGGAEWVNELLEGICSSCWILQWAIVRVGASSLASDLMKDFQFVFCIVLVEMHYLKFEGARYKVSIQGQPT